MACHGGHHTWTVNPPTLGTPCARCPRTWAPRGSYLRKAAGPAPPPQEPVAPKLGPAAVVSLPAPSDRLVEALTRLRERTTAAAAPATPVVAEPVAPPAARAPSRVAQRIAVKLTQVFEAATDAVIESLPGKLRRKPGEADPSDLEDFENAAAEIVQRWIPDAALGPYGNLALAAVYVVGGKWADGEPLNRPARAVAPVAATSTTAPSQPAPTSSPPAAPPATAEPELLPAAGGF